MFALASSVWKSRPLDPQTDRVEQASERRPYRFVVVDDENDRLFGHHARWSWMACHDVLSGC
jgi:hypothetical protein